VGVAVQRPSPDRKQYGTSPKVTPALPPAGVGVISIFVSLNTRNSRFERNLVPLWIFFSLRSVGA